MEEGNMKQGEAEHLVGTSGQLYDILEKAEL